jgi:hypothetical protein
MDGRSLEDMGTLPDEGGLACAGAGTHRSPSGARHIPGKDPVGHRLCGGNRDAILSAPRTKVGA